MIPPPLLELRDVHAGYGAIEVLHGICIAVGKGQIVAMLGPTGAGKSTTLKVASGLMRPSRGTLRVAGHDATGVAANALARAGMCTIPEGRGIFPNLTVRDRVSGVPRGDGLSHSGEHNLYDAFDMVPPEYHAEFHPNVLVRNWQGIPLEGKREDWISEEVVDEGRFIPLAP